MTNEQMTHELSPAPRWTLKMKMEYRRNYARSHDFGLLRNISLTGACLQISSYDVTPNDKLILTFSVSGRNREIQATVVWKKDQACGIKLIPASNRDIQIIDDMIYFVKAHRENKKVLLEGIFDRIS